VEELLAEWEENAVPLKKNAKATALRFRLDLSVEEKREIRDQFKG
jgi:hypothetical protein